MSCSSRDTSCPSDALIMYRPRSRGRREGRAPADAHGPRATKSTRQNHRCSRNRPLGSGGRRNTGSFSFHRDQQGVKRLGWRFPAECLSRTAVESGRNRGYLIGIIDAEIGTLGEVLPQQPIGVLVRAALPGTSWIAEVDLDSCVDPKTTVLSHFDALVPGQRTTQFFGQGDDGARDRVAYSFGSVS